MSVRALELSKNIKTFHEQTTSPEALYSMRQAIAEAELIAFLGFAYHDINMKLLYTGATGVLKNILGTAYNIKSDNVAIIKNSLLPRLIEDRTVEPQLVDLNCAQFFDHFERRLAFS